MCCNSLTVCNGGVNFVLNYDRGTGCAALRPPDLREAPRVATSARRLARTTHDAPPRPLTHRAKALASFPLLRNTRFAALQSDAGRALLQRCGRAPTDISSIVLVEKGRRARPAACAASCITPSPVATQLGSESLPPRAGTSPSLTQCSGSPKRSRRPSQSSQPSAGSCRGSFATRSMISSPPTGGFGTCVLTPLRLGLGVRSCGESLSRVLAAQRTLSGTPLLRADTGCLDSRTPAASATRTRQRASLARDGAAAA